MELFGDGSERIMILLHIVSFIKCCLRNNNSNILGFPLEEIEINLL
jgi:hypothetical protein